MQDVNVAASGKFMVIVSLVVSVPEPSRALSA